MTNTRFICHVLTPRQKYGKFNVGCRPLRIREYTTMNNKSVLYIQMMLILLQVVYTAFSNKIKELRNETVGIKEVLLQF